MDPKRRFPSRMRVSVHANGTIYVRSYSDRALTISFDPPDGPEVTMFFVNRDQVIDLLQQTYNVLFNSPNWDEPRQDPDLVKEASDEV